MSLLEYVRLTFGLDCMKLDNKREAFLQDLEDIKNIKSRAALACVTSDIAQHLYCSTMHSVILSHW